MRKLFIALSVLFFLITPIANAGGGMTHMFIAAESVNKIPDTGLRTLLQNNFEAYVVGAYYPDSGFIAGNLYGEDSHWDPFIYTFADEIKGKYTDPTIENPKLVAFLFGCAVHRLSDEVIHWTFYNDMAARDFNNDWNEAHQYGDTGIDLLLNIDKDQWGTHPLTWWVPVKDLVEVYHRMGKDQYTANQIIWGNSVLFLAGYGERIISAPAYPYLKWRMPWTAANYYNWPNGGILDDENKTVAYMMKLWTYLNDKNANTHPMMNLKHRSYLQAQSNLITDFASNALQNGVVNVPTTTNEDGSVELSEPVVTQYEKFRSLLTDLINKLTS